MKHTERKISQREKLMLITFDLILALFSLPLWLLLLLLHLSTHNSHTLNGENWHFAIRATDLSQIKQHKIKRIRREEKKNNSSSSSSSSYSSFVIAIFLLHSILSLHSRIFFFLFSASTKNSYGLWECDNALGRKQKEKRGKKIFFSNMVCSQFQNAFT